MARRKNTFKVDASEVQEEGWVEYRAMNYKRSKFIAVHVKAIQNDDSLDPGEQTQRILEVSEKLLHDHILDWNWVDDDGNPLPVPSVDPDVIDLLTADEVAFLSKALSGDQERKK